MTTVGILRSILAAAFLATFIAATFHPNEARGYFEYSKNLDGKTGEMNGLKFDDYKDFTKTWHLVTVRFRQDTKEMRIAYANDLAWKEMQSAKTAYSDGAVFAKVGLITEKDPAFPSSEVPAGTKRFQIMYRDKKKFASTQGWGYALFDSNGQLFDEDPKLQSTACAACHALVPERGYVFSRPMNIGFGANTLALQTPATSDMMKMESKPKDRFSKAFQNEFPKAVVAVMSLEGELKKKSFSGTLDEIVPFLIENVRFQGKSSTLYIDENNFTLVVPLPLTPAPTGGEAPKCEGTKLAMRVLIQYKGSKVRDSASCY